MSDIQFRWVVTVGSDGWVDEQMGRQAGRWLAGWVMCR